MPRPVELYSTVICRGGNGGTVRLLVEQWGDPIAMLGDGALRRGTFPMPTVHGQSTTIVRESGALGVSFGDVTLRYARAEFGGAVGDIDTLVHHLAFAVVVSGKRVLVGPIVELPRRLRLPIAIARDDVMHVELAQDGAPLVINPVLVRIILGGDAADL